VGVDAETVSRFDERSPAGDFLPFVFSDDEAHACEASVDPALAFAAAFTCKEALLKATRSPFSYPGCVIPPAAMSVARDGVSVEAELVLSTKVARALRVKQATARLWYEDGEVVALVHAFGEAEI
jgi:phosphopantetheinyl transferase (holo-ACP synthase)